MELGQWGLVGVGGVWFSGSVVLGGSVESIEGLVAAIWVESGGGVERSGSGGRLVGGGCGDNWTRSVGGIGNRSGGVGRGCPLGRWTVRSELLSVMRA